MKKLALALVASTVLVGATSANVATGFYLGANVGYGSTKGKVTAHDGVAAVSGSRDAGNDNANIGVIGGYGWLNGCFYLGGEIGYTFENVKIRDTLGAAGGAFMQLKRNGYFSAALRGGYLLTRDTMMYLRLAGNWGKYKLDVNDGVNSYSGSKNRLSFAPGIGLETAFHKNVYLRLEYSYEFGTSVRATHAATGAYTNVGTLRNQSTKLGVVYKF